MPGPQYFQMQNPFYDWDTFTGMMNNAARTVATAGPVGMAANYFANQPQQGGMPQQLAQRPTMPEFQGYDQYPYYAADRALSNRGYSDYSMFSDPRFLTASAGQPPMPYVNYDPNLMTPMDSFGNGYYQELPQESAAVRRARQGVMPVPRMTLGRPADVEKL